MMADKIYKKEILKYTKKMLKAGKLIGGGLATFGLAGAAIGVGLVFAA